MRTGVYLRSYKISSADSSGVALQDDKQTVSFSAVCFGTKNISGKDKTAKVTTRKGVVM
jgi:hypothetical protein